jgi:hypothetical protein
MVSSMRKVDTITRQRTKNTAPTKRAERRHGAELKDRVMEVCEARGGAVIRVRADFDTAALCHVVRVLRDGLLR